MKLSKHTYEAWLLDLWEGRLNAAEAALLKQFILDHPEFGTWEDLSGDLPVLSETTLQFPDKESLKRSEIHTYSTVAEQNTDDWFIAFYEGTLSEAETNSLQEFLKLNPELEPEFQLFGKLYIKPDTQVVYPFKSQLRESLIPVQTRLYRYVAVAASLLMLIGLGWLLMPEVNYPTHNIEQPALVSLPMIPVPDKIDLTHTSDHTPRMEKPVAVMPQVKPEPELLSEENRYDMMEIPMLTAKLHSEPIISLMPQYHIIDPKYESREQLLAALNAEFNNQQEVSRNLSVLLAFQRTVEGGRELAQSVISWMKKEEKQVLPVDGASLWDLAESGVKTYNALTNKEVQLLRLADDEGRTLYVVFQSENMYFSKNF